MNKKYLLIVLGLLGGIVGTSLFATISNVSVRSTISDISSLQARKEELIKNQNSLTSVTFLSKEVEKLGFVTPEIRSVLLDNFALR